MQRLIKIALFTVLAAAALAQAPQRGVPRAESNVVFAGEVAVRSPQAATVRIEIRSWIVPNATRVEKLPLPEGGTIIVEVIAGELTTIVGGRRYERHEGDFFTVLPGEKLGVETDDDSVTFQTTWIMPAA
jgi:quercetin dioxygenase-like cupin family protein